MSDVYSILCAACRTRLFVYRGDFSGPVRISDFSPCAGTIAPKKGEPMVCSTCGKAWYLLNARTRGIIVLTDKGFRPREPKESTGKRSSVNEPRITAETPPEFRGNAPDYTDVTHRG